MSALGFVLLVIGAILVVAEAHAPAGVLGVAGGIALMAGGMIAIAAAGGGAIVAVPVGVGLGLGAAGWALLVTRSVAGVRRRQIRAGTEALHGRVGVVRRWNEPSGQVFVDGALWRARHDHAGDAPLHEGDEIVVEQIRGLTLGVRRAEEWELIA